jgi:hypothetical protein
MAPVAAVQILHAPMPGSPDESAPEFDMRLSSHRQVTSSTRPPVAVVDKEVRADFLDLDYIITGRLEPA